ncbi:MAG: ABC transporter ATP-binding protein [Firmicutes bacterium]|nr:ABC transporter ATP-binding protein [Bacillota bacterium]
MALITAENISIGYGSRTIIKDLNFSVDTGDYLCIIGENGVGKTTLMKTMLGLMKPLSGRILLGEGLKNNMIGYLPQRTTVQKDFPASVWEIVLSGFQGRCGARPFYDRKEKLIAKDNIERMEISSLSKRSYMELSGGQQQRVLLARALCAAQEILLLDEPITGLDPRAASEMYGLISKLNKEGMTIIMISHDISESVKYASHVLHIGKNIFFGSKEKYFESDEGKVFLMKNKGGEDR